MSAKAPYQKVYNREGDDLGLQVLSMEYIYSEKLDDHCTVILESNDPTYADNRYVQEDSALYMEWGYLGEPHSKTVRKVYIIESTINFNAHSMTLTLQCVPLASYLKWKSGMGIIKEKTITEFLGEEFNKLGNGAGKFIQEYTDKETGETFAVATIGLPHGNLQTFATEITDEGATVIPQMKASEILPARYSTANVSTHSWRISTLPQTGQSVASAIDKMVIMEGEDNVVVSGRDDELVIKKRNFDQAPILAVKWNGLPHNLLAFKAGVKNLMDRATTKIATSGWDIENKEHARAEVTAASENSTVLGETIPTDRVNKKEGDDGQVGGFFDINSTYDIKALRTEVNQARYEVAQAYGMDELYSEEDRVYFDSKKVNIDGVQHLYVASRGPQVGFLNTKGLRGYAAAVDNTEVADAYLIPAMSFSRSIEEAEAAIKSAIYERSRNPLIDATMEIEGNSKVIEGVVVKVEGVGKKYSGNWYVVKATHTLSTQGWLVSAELSRNGLGDLDGFETAFIAAREIQRRTNLKEAEAIVEETRLKTRTDDQKKADERLRLAEIDYNNMFNRSVGIVKGTTGDAPAPTPNNSDLSGFPPIQ